MITWTVAKMICYSVSLGLGCFSLGFAVCNLICFYIERATETKKKPKRKSSKKMKKDRNSNTDNGDPD